MIHFDEISVAEEIESTKGFKKGCTRTNLCLFAKWLRYKKIKELGISYDDITIEEMARFDKYTETALINFCENNCRDFNYTIKFNDVDIAVDYSRKYKIKRPLPVFITQKEWDAVSSLDNDNYRRMLFVMLVNAKYCRMYNTTIGAPKNFNENTVFYCQMTKSEIYKAGKVKFADQEECDLSLSCLYNKGFFDITENRLRSWIVKIVDISTNNIIDYITDYNKLNLHYEKLMGLNIGVCEHCGKLFRQNKNGTAKFCKEHRGYQKKELRSGICVDCGNKFFVAANNQKKVRCDCCQKEYIKEYDRHRKQKL